MNIVNANIRFLRKGANFTQQQLADKLSIKRSLLGAYEEGRAEPRLSVLTNLAEIFHTSVDALISLNLENEPEINWKNRVSADTNSILAITVSEEGEENIEWVPQKAAAGYTTGFSDPEFIQELPRFRLPMLPNGGTYRAFEITGDSMLPILPGTVIIGEYLEKLTEIKSGKTYILVTENDGIVYKRVFNYLDENGKIFLVSDNRQYEPYQLDGSEIREVWSAKAFISIQFPDVGSMNDNDMTTEKLAALVMELQKEIIQLKEK